MFSSKLKRQRKFSQKKEIVNADVHSLIHCKSEKASQSILNSMNKSELHIIAKAIKTTLKGITTCPIND